MSGSVLLLTYKGRRSGRTYATPVSYVREGGDVLLVSGREHSWKNLRGGAPVTLCVRGQDEEGMAETFEGGAAEGGAGLLAVPCAVPAYRRHWKVDLGPNGRSKDPENFARVAEENVLVRVRDLAEVRQA
jgi:hypothetical protein